MYDYQMVKSIHDQRMHQYHIEAERAHLLRQLRKNRPTRVGLVGRMTLRFQEAFESVSAGLRPKRLST